MKILLVSADRTIETGDPQNIGDALLTDALAGALDAAGHDVRVADFSRSRRTAGGAERVLVLGLGGLGRAISWSDAVIIGGGTLLADDQPTRLFAGLPRLCLSTAALASGFRKKLAVFGVGVDPIRRRRARSAVKVVLRLAAVWVRDADSARRALLLSRRKTIRVSGDVSLAAWETIAAAAVPVAERAGVVVALNRREAALLAPEDVDLLKSRHGSVRFLSMDQGPDPDAEGLPSAVAERISVVEGSGPWTRAVAEIARAEKVIASRMHAMYIASMLSVPVVAVGTAPKVLTFVDDFAVAHADDVRGACSTDAQNNSARAEAQAAVLSTAFSELAEWLDGSH